MYKMNTLVLIVTYNGHSDIEKCLRSLDLSKFDVMVVDNASTDDTKEIIITKFPNVILYESVKNLGFGQANNIGFRYALENGYDYVLLLNQDAWLENDTIDKLIEAHRKNKDYWVLSPMQMHSKLNDIEPQFKVYIQRYNINTSAESIQQTPYVNAAIWLLPIETINKVGGFDPLFPHYGEDDDYINRVIYHGGKIGIYPKSIGYHDRNIQQGTISLERLRYLTRLIYVKKLKDLETPSVFARLCYAMLMYLRQNIKSLAKFDFKKIHARTLALRDALNMTYDIKNHIESSKTPKAFL